MAIVDQLLKARVLHLRTGLIIICRVINQVEIGRCDE